MHLLSWLVTYITHRTPRSQLSTSLGENVKSFLSRLICAGPSLLEFIPAMELRYELVMAAFLSSSFEGIMAAMNGVGLQRSSHPCSPSPLCRTLSLAYISCFLQIVTLYLHNPYKPYRHRSLPVSARNRLSTVVNMPLKKNPHVSESASVGKPAKLEA